MPAPTLCVWCLGIKKWGRKSVSDTDHGSFQYEVCHMPQSDLDMDYKQKQICQYLKLSLFFPVNWEKQTSQLFSNYLNVSFLDEH